MRELSEIRVDQVQDHGQLGIPFHINGGKGDPQSRTAPDNAEECPTPHRGVGTDTAKHHGGICACDQQEYGAMVDDLHDPLAQAQTSME